MFDPGVEVNPAEVEEGINKLAAGKSCAMDGVYAEHLKYCSTDYMALLAKCMSSFLVHGFLPDSLMSVVLVPMIKDKYGIIFH